MYYTAKNVYELPLEIWPFQYLSNTFKAIGNGNIFCSAPIDCMACITRIASCTAVYSPGV